MNDIKLLGRFVETPELKTTINGTDVTTFNFAVPRGYKDKDGNVITDFFVCFAWKKTAEFITRYFRKGSQALLSGSLETRDYEDKDGNKRKAVEIRVEKVFFTGSKKDNAGNENTTPQNTTPQYTAADFEEIDDDYPF